MNPRTFHLVFVAAMSLLVAWILCYGALRTAERIARRQIQTQTEFLDQ